MRISATMIAALNTIALTGSAQGIRSTTVHALASRELIWDDDNGVWYLTSEGLDLGVVSDDAVRADKARSDNYSEQQWIKAEEAEEAKDEKLTFEDVMAAADNPAPLTRRQIRITKRIEKSWRRAMSVRGDFVCACGKLTRVLRNNTIERHSSCRHAGKRVSA